MRSTAYVVPCARPPLSFCFGGAGYEAITFSISGVGGGNLETPPAQQRRRGSYPSLDRILCGFALSLVFRDVWAIELVEKLQGLSWAGAVGSAHELFAPARPINCVQRMGRGPARPIALSIFTARSIRTPNTSTLPNPARSMTLTSKLTRYGLQTGQPVDFTGRATRRPMDCFVQKSESICDDFSF